MRRLAALVIAVALVVGALVIRSRRDAEERLGPYRLTCSTELAEVCRSLPTSDVTVTIEPAGVTADRLIALTAGADFGFDGWLSAGRWPAIVADGRRIRSLRTIGGRTDVVGHTRVAVAGWRDRLSVTRQSCGGTLTWRCIGDVAGRVTWKANTGPETWGLVKIALPSPVAESAGLAGLAAATAGFDSKLVSGAVDPAQNDAYLRWLSSVAKAIPDPIPGIESMLTARGVVDLYVGLEAQINSLLSTAANKQELEVVNLSPVLDIEAIVLTGSRRIPSSLRAAVRDAGWTPDRDAAATSLPTPPVLAGLRALWKETF